MMRNIFDKFKQLATARQELEKSCDTFFNIVMKEIISGTEAVVNGRPTILAGSNNYLGLSFDSDCIDAACNAARKEGTGTTGSRMANGTFAGHLALEQELAEYFDRQNAIVFSTGYIANLAMLSTLVGHGEVILLDADCHASIYDGCRLGGAEVIRAAMPQRLAHQQNEIHHPLHAVLALLGGDVADFHGARRIVNGEVDRLARPGS